MNRDRDSVDERARRLLETEFPGLESTADALTLAWALKGICYQAWGSEPSRAARAAACLRTLFEASVAAADADEVEALAEWTAGIASTTRGQMSDAVESFDRAAAAFRRVGKPDPAAQTQVPKIMALSMLGRHEQATACALETQRQLVALGNLAAASRVSLNLGGAYLRRDDYAAAARHYREAAVLFARVGDHAQSILSDIGMADALAALGDFDEALRMYARARMRAVQRRFDVSVALADESIALVELARGRYREALAGLESARRSYAALALPQHLAIAEKQLGDAYLELRLLPEALALFEVAIATFHALESPDEQAWALAQRGRAQTLLQQGDADASFAQALTLFVAQGNDVGRAAVTLARAELALSRDDVAGAVDLAQQAAQAFGSAGQADGCARAEVVHAQALVQQGRFAEAAVAFDATLARARAQRQTAVQVRCLTGRGLVAQAAGDTGAAIGAFEAAIELFEDQRRALPGDDMRSAFLTEHLRPYQERLRLALHGGDACDVLTQLDRFRARSLEERLCEESAPAADDDLHRLRTRLNWLYRRANRLLEESGGPAVTSAEVLRLEHELLERARRGRLTAPRRAGEAASRFSVDTLQRALADGDALVEYGVLDDELFACVVTPGGVQLVRQLASWSKVLDAVRSARFQIDTLRHGAAPVRRHLAALLARVRARMAALHALVWAPLSATLGASTRVIVVPHAQLALLPFAALHDAAGALGDRFDLAVSSSARMALRGLGRPSLPPRRVLALGESSRLAHAAREAQAVATQFEAGAAFVGTQASVATLDAHGRHADVLHLACHGVFRSDNPRFSALTLSDEALTVERAESLGLKACTVVLSACETGVTALSSGDEMIGLVRAFMIAGAARVLASLWPVDDDVTADFMARFYGALVKGAGPAAALRAAQVATAREHPHPYFWAAFTLYGGW